MTKMSRMRRMLWMLLALAVLLPAPAVPAQAASSTIAMGVWQVTTASLDVKVAGGRTLITTHQDGTWTGTFTGTSTDVGQVVIEEDGFWSFEARVSFVGTVAGKLGTVELSVGATRPAGSEAEWKGQWAILSGTGGLAALSGQGTWWGHGTPYPQVWGDIPYAGQLCVTPLLGKLYSNQQLA